jgi:hypothetical protein
MPKQMPWLSIRCHSSLVNDAPIKAMLQSSQFARPLARFHSLLLTFQKWFPERWSFLFRTASSRQGQWQAVRQEALGGFRSVANSK